MAFISFNFPRLLVANSKVGINFASCFAIFLKKPALICYYDYYYDNNIKNLTFKCVYAIILLSKIKSILIRYTVANFRHPLRLNVGFIINQPIGYNRDFDFNFSDIQLHPDLDLTMLTGSTRIGRTPQGLLVQGKFSAVSHAQCVRCLTDTEQKLQTEFDELYAFSSRTASESELILPEDGYIDLEPILREYILLELPISPLCQPDCKGLCSVCGQDLNQAICEHQA